MARSTHRRGEAVTVQDVAARAGVSAMTVSNVIRSAGKVGAATRARVLEAIAELGYTPNLAARTLAGAEVTRIGLIYRGADSLFTSALIVGASTVAAARGLQLLIREVAEDTTAATAAAAQALVRSGADALLLVPPFAELLSGAPAAGELKAPIAAIATGRVLPGMITVRIDNEQASRALVERLIAQGHRRIGVIAGPAAHSDMLARLEGYAAALRAHGLPLDPELQARGDFSFAAGIAAAEALLAIADPPTAIVAANDDMAAAVLWVAHRRGVRVPQDLSVTGFDDTFIATRVWPALTVVRQPVAAMAELAVERLVAELREPDPARPRDLVLDFTLVERDSTGPAPAAGRGKTGL